MKKISEEQKNYLDGRKKMANTNFSISETEIKILEKMALKVKKSQKSYSHCRLFFLACAVVSFALGVIGAVTGIDSDYWFAFVLAVPELLMAIVGVDALIRFNYRKAVKNINTKIKSPTFGRDGVAFSAQNGTINGCTWSELAAYTKMEHSSWIISDKKSKRVVIYLSPVLIPEPDYETILRLLAENGVWEIKVEELNKD